MKRCPECAEQVQSAALVCRFCRHRFSEPDSLGALNDKMRRWTGNALYIGVVLLAAIFIYQCSAVSNSDIANQIGTPT
jgi:hypothetical protein